MKKMIEELNLKYTIRREYGTVIIPVTFALLIIVAGFTSGFVTLGTDDAVGSMASDRQKAYEEMVRQLKAEEEGYTPEPEPGTAEPVSGTFPLDQFLIIVTILAILPYAIDITLEKRKIRQKENLYTEFLFKLSELMRGGLDPVKAVIELSKNNLGPLTPHIRLAATAMTFGKSFEEAMTAMTGTLRSELITRYTMLVVQASYSGGSTSDLILKASEDMRSLIGIEREKEGNLSQYTMIFYFAQGILFFIALTLTTSLLPYLQDLGSGSFLGLGGAGLSDLNFAGGFFHLLMINAFFGGLIIGKISEGEARFGLKHSVILMTAGYIACIILLLPAAQAPPPGDVRIEIISGGGQQGFAALPLTQPVIVKVTDPDGTPIEKADVTFGISPGGVMKPASTRTDAEGIAEARIVLGPEPGLHTITVTVQGVSAVTMATATGEGE